MADIVEFETKLNLSFFYLILSLSALLPDLVYRVVCNTRQKSRQTIKKIFHIKILEEWQFVDLLINLPLFILLYENIERKKILSYT